MSLQTTNVHVCVQWNAVDNPIRLISTYSTYQFSNKKMKEQDEEKRTQTLLGSSMKKNNNKLNQMMMTLRYLYV